MTGAVMSGRNTMPRFAEARRPAAITTAASMPTTTGLSTESRVSDIELYGSRVSDQT
jgi:hypothetical protein